MPNESDVNKTHRLLGVLMQNQQYDVAQGVVLASIVQGQLEGVTKDELNTGIKLLIEMQMAGLQTRIADSSRGVLEILDVLGIPLEDFETQAAVIKQERAGASHGKTN